MKFHFWLGQKLLRIYYSGYDAKTRTEQNQQEKKQ